MHEEHRKRMRERFLLSGFDGFSDHEILECLLYFSIPRSDTNELAHKLMERFGSIRNLLEATPEELAAEDGIGERSVFLFKLTCETLRRYAKDTLVVPPAFRTLSSISEYLCRKFVGLGVECVYLMLLNNRLSLIDCCKLAEGTVNKATIPLRKITESTIFRKASVAVLAHNHPNGYAYPSESDLEVTGKIAETLDTIGVPLLEHLIVADDNVFPVLKSGKCRNAFKLPESVAKSNPMFLENFYDIDYETWRFTFYRDLASEKETK
ncbi:MAG: hypothetical protein E7680_00890 [Ruminococcaceae bacterium]|nr:hypothetical protein [Oscillospiraceae bacterium]